MTDSPIPGSKRSIMMVDDNPEVVEVARITLEGKGFNVRCAYSDPTLPGPRSTRADCQHTTRARASVAGGCGNAQGADRAPPYARAGKASPAECTQPAAECCFPGLVEPDAQARPRSRRSGVASVTKQHLGGAPWLTEDESRDLRGSNVRGICPTCPAAPDSGSGIPGLGISAYLSTSSSLSAASL